MKHVGATIAAFLLGTAIAVLALQYLSLGDFNLATITSYSSLIGFSVAVSVGIVLFLFVVGSHFLRGSIRTDIAKLIQQSGQGASLGTILSGPGNVTGSLIDKASSLVVSFVVTRGAMLILISVLANVILIAQLNFAQQQTTISRSQTKLIERQLEVAEQQNKLLASQTEAVQRQVATVLIEEFRYLNDRLRALNDSRLVLRDLVDSRFTYWPGRHVDVASAKTANYVALFPEMASECGKPPLSMDMCNTVKVKDAFLKNAFLSPRLLRLLRPPQDKGNSQLDQQRRAVATKYADSIAVLVKASRELAEKKGTEYNIVGMGRGIRADGDFLSFTVARLAFDCGLPEDQIRKVSEFANLSAMVESALIAAGKDEGNESAARKIWRLSGFNLPLLQALSRLNELKLFGTLLEGEPTKEELEAMFPISLVTFLTDAQTEEFRKMDALGRRVGELEIRQMLAAIGGLFRLTTKEIDNVKKSCDGEFERVEKARAARSGRILDTPGK